ncbi:taste receptor type 2 member 40-like [Pelobates fuscus]|uniref:taste receptor type 2 member 40-like n=1 Tax=Pelobates fuscus TaxID=191477 RepID=UPI002FE465EA
MLPLFLIVSMAILGSTSILGIVLNCIILCVNFVQKEKGKSLGPSELILVTLGISNITFQVVMTANDLMIILASDLYYSDGVCTTIKVLLFIPIFSSFWFTVCLCVYYCLQIVIFTHPFLMRLKMEIATLVPCFLVTSFFVAVIISVPVFWSTYREPVIGNFSSNQTLEMNAPKLSITYLLPTSIIGSSLPLLLVAISNGIILKSLMSASNKLENTSSVQSPHAEARERAARTVGCLLLLYMSFYISELLMFTSLFPPNSPGFCACLMVIYTYSPIQSLILILGSPKLKKVLLGLFQISMMMSKETETIKTIS